ncbi:uncharacterized protein Z520_08259 [Fonsecaea multimorphosa CBS 102226]|uniref:Carrier domain-containing protein n=1 Tax=Fonsecaea multimorphosa CBS 102226 TaxID=1442371 RepID=A0A0D2JZI7_9EURO|nr:uncharacterized protein Z520_08259 [Fonsecaea multimorphosa CBS 102226]KIX96004.1 hypothetical protein Z520_08259 [Fonsecaea multimorphosa CBS 102226]
MVSWLLDTERTLPQVLEKRAKTVPHGLFAKVPLSPTSYSSGFRAATNLEVSNAVDEVAWLIEKELGRPKDFPTIAYLGPADLRYSIVVMAAMKTGHKTFLPSPRNSMAAFNSLLSGLDCQIIVTVSPEPPIVSAITAEREMKKLNLPSLFDLLDKVNVPRYPYDKTFEEARWDPILVLHTSGSTGIPKPLTYTNEFVSSIAKNISLIPPEGFRSLDVYVRTGLFFIFLPPFHIAGIAFSLIVPIFCDDAIPIYPLSGSPPTVADLLEARNHTHADWAFVAPVMVDEIGKTSALLESFSAKFTHLFYSGGAVPKISGDAVAARMGLYQILGSSECASFPLIRDAEDQSCNQWDCVQIHPAVNAQFQHRFGSLHELVLVRKDDLLVHQPVFWHFPEQQAYETRDLFEQVSPNIWLHRSRIDDIIVFLNGEKTNPISFEQEVGRHPEVRSALVAGMQRFEATLLVELLDHAKSLADGEAALVNRIWPTVEEANKVTPSHARVAKSKIIIIDPLMPMPRAGKGTVQRQATWNLYAQKLEAVYDADENGGAQPPSEDITIMNDDEILKVVQESVTGTMHRDTVEVGDGFFDLGMDSLMVLRLGRDLKARLGITVDMKAIYGNPSIDKLTAHILELARNPNAVIGDQAGGAQEVAMDAMLEGYGKEIKSLKIVDSVKRNGLHAHPPEQVVLLTGSTGAVGSHILRELLKNDSVRHIYCLNRADDSELLQTKRNIKRDLPTDFPPSRVTFLTANLARKDFGLGKKVHQSLLSQVTHIVLNAWPVNFNLPLSAFKTALDGVLNTIDFAQQSHVSPSITFLSSISSMTNYSGGQIPEKIVRDVSCPASMGYGQSKYIAERMLDYASQQLQIKTKIIRVGQIAGTAENPRGWNRDEWLPSLVLSSKYLGAVPASLGRKTSTSPDGMMGTIDWIPIDQLAGILTELTLASENGVFHAVNPAKISWAKLLPTVQEELSGVTVSSYEDWLQLLKSRTDSEVDADAVRQNPGLKLIDFYESLLQDKTSARFSTEQSVLIGKRLSRLEAINTKSIAGWIKNWLAES